MKNFTGKNNHSINIKDSEIPNTSKSFDSWNQLTDFVFFLNKRYDIYNLLLQRIKISTTRLHHYLHQHPCESNLPTKLRQYHD